MPEANVLFTVTAVVVAGLVVWILATLKMAKEPWARPEAAAAAERAAIAKKRDADVKVEKAEEKPEEKAEVEEKADADEKPAEEAAEEEKKEEEKEEKKADA